jgi:hypothetical protein
MPRVGHTLFSFQLQEEFEDTKRVIGIRKSKDRQHNDQTKKEQRTRIDQVKERSYKNDIHHNI